MGAARLPRLGLPGDRPLPGQGRRLRQDEPVRGRRRDPERRLVPDPGVHGLSLGQGPGRWNSFGFDYTPEEYAEKQLQEIKHCRLAMLGIIGLAAKSSGAGDVGVLAMLGGGKPEFVTKAGFYFPEGI